MTKKMIKKRSLLLIKKHLNLQIVFLLVSSSLFFAGCCAYSFTGSSVPEHLTTIAIPVAEDRSGSGEPGLRELLTNRLNEKFIDDNSLDITDRSKANSILECTITSLSDAPAAIAAGEQVTRRKITIAVYVVYKDAIKRKNVFERTFTNFAEYVSGAGLNERRQVIDEVIDRISEDILLETVSGW